MSHFLCLATPPEISAETIVSAFAPRVCLTSATASVIGELTRGKYAEWDVNFVWLGSDSFALIFKQPDALAMALQTLLEDEECREVHFLAHLFTGNLDTEAIELKEQRRFHPEALSDVCGQIELDARYVVAKRYPWEEL